MMRPADIKFLEESFKKYYFEHLDQIRVPERTSEREFGFQKFSSGMIRHIQIKNDKELHLLFMQNIPSDVYCSNSYYLFPELPINEKNWKEADLIFDIDAKDLRLSCRKDHTLSVCSECNDVSKNLDKCVKCSSARLEKKSLPCQKCIDASKVEVSKLCRILTDDFAISQEDIHVYFSGNEGFHVHVYDLQFRQIGKQERSDLAEYIMFQGAIPETFGMKKHKPTRQAFPDFDEGGWRGRFAKQAYGSKSRRSKAISDLLAGGYSSFQKTLEDASEKIGVRIDPGVTTDIHRIFRLPGSINSKSGLVKTLSGDLGTFDPYVEASRLSDDSVQVFANSPIGFRLRNGTFGPYYGEKVTVPTFVAVYMICKRLATLA